VQPKDSGLKEVGHIIGEQPRTISVNRLKRRMGFVRGLVMQKIEDILRMILGL
jgi:mRNA-degrading endonuclease toxin of MazEF toxin-antitoxin module